MNQDIYNQNINNQNIKTQLRRGTLMNYLHCDISSSLIQPLIDVKKIINNNIIISDVSMSDNCFHVPKDIHFIWIGSIIPKKYIDNIKSYIKNNPTYKIYLWLDNIIELENIIIKDVNHDIELLNKKLFIDCKNYGIKADILRYEIIYNFGGIYCDVDSISLKSFDTTFLTPCVSYILPCWYNLTNAFFCFEKKSNFLKYCIECLKYTYNLKLPLHFNTGPTFFTTCFYLYNMLNINMIPQSLIINKSYNGYTYHTNDHNWK